MRGLAKRIVGQPAFWILAVAGFQAACLPDFLQTIGSGDTQDYWNLATAPWTLKVLTCSRTLAYPLFLKVLGVDENHYAHLAAFQFLIFVGAACALAYALRALAVPRALATAAAIGLLFSGPITTTGRFHRLIMTDSLGISCAIFAVASLLGVVARPTRLRWAALGLSTFLAYQVRPVFLFLLAYLPLLGALLRWRSTPDRGALRRFLVTCGMVFALPYFAFCAARWALVGDFGLVSFSDVAAIGITSQLLDDELVGQLSGETQDYARHLLEQLRQVQAPIGFAIRRWESPLRGRYGLYRSQLGGQFNLASWIAIGVAKAMSGDDPVKANHLMSRYSRSVLIHRPIVYLVWLAKSFFTSLSLVWEQYAFYLPGLILLAALALEMAGRAIGRWPAPRPMTAADRAGMEVIWITATSFFLADLLTVILVEEPLGRYVYAAATLTAMIPFGVAILLLGGLARGAGLASETLAPSLRIIRGQKSSAF